MESLKINLVGNLPATSSEDTLVVSSEADYCHISHLLREDLAAGYRSVWVRESHLFSWLKVQVEHLGFLHLRPVEFARTTPSLLLGEKWGFEIPEWISGDLILEEGLLEQKLPPGSRDVATGLLAPWLGEMPATLPSRLCGVIAEKASDPAVDDALKRPLLKAAWEALVDQWRLSGAAPWLEPYCVRLISDPKGLWRDLTAWRLLRNYPVAAADYALGPSVATFVRSLPADAVQEMTLNSEGRRLALDQIEQMVNFADVRAVTRAKFTGLLEAVSGELKEEFSALESTLEKADFEVTTADLSAIKQRFKNCGELSTVDLGRLSLLVRPRKPAPVENESPGGNEWARWAKEQYFPYRWWQIERKTLDGDVERSVAAFSDWYCRNYALVHSEPALSGVQTLSRWRESILRDKVSLVLLVDNLPWFFWDLFEKAMVFAGLHRHEGGISFAPLPSHTAVCKPLLVSGQQGASGSDYLKMLKRRSAEEWQNRKVHYTMGVDQLATLPVGPEPRLVLLNYLASDDVLHSDAEASGSSWSEQLELHFKSLARAVAVFARRAVDSGGEFGLYVCTDHGATLVLADEKKSTDAQLTKRLFPNEKHRSATLTAAEANAVPENLWELGHRLTSPLTDGIHFIPRGHNTVAPPGNRLKFSHGGATPEEVLVPSGVFRLYWATWKPPSVRFLGLNLKDGKSVFYVKRITSLELEIQNTNNEECLLDSVTIAPEVAAIRELTPVSILPGNTGQARVSLYFASDATAISEITFKFTFQFGQDPVAQSVTLPVKILSATSGGVDLRELL